MKKYIYQTVFFLVFIIWFGLLFGEKYWNFQQGQREIQVYNEEVQQHIASLSNSNLQTWEADVELYYTPYLSLLDDLVERIENAEERVYVEAYIFTETRLRDALISAHKRGIDVKILLENNPYKAPYLNDKHFNTFKESDLSVKWSDPLNYSLNHAKFFIIDESAFISTGNISYSLFKYNRDFIVEINQQALVEKIVTLFKSDFQHIKQWVIDENLVLSPDYSREKLSALIDASEKSIDFYFPYIADEAFKKLLFEAAERGIKIRGIVEKNFYHENTQLLEEFTAAGIEISFLQSHKLHGKAMLFDDNLLYIWSINFSTFSFDENRELWVILKDFEVIQKFKKLFNSDF